MKKYICLDCGEQCYPEEETFWYSGTHCTNGKTGIHRTGHYFSSCCESEYTEERRSEERLAKDKELLDNMLENAIKELREGN